MYIFLKTSLVLGNILRLECFQTNWKAFILVAYASIEAQKRQYYKGNFNDLLNRIS